MGSTIRKGVLQLTLGEPAETKNAAVRGIVFLGDQSLEAWVKVVPTRELLVECLCALMVRDLGFNGPEPLLILVPGALTANGKPVLAFGSVAASFGALRPWLVRIGEQAVVRLLRTWPGLSAAACFDEWIGNCDRQAGNILFDGMDQFWLIDHGQAVPDTTDPAAEIPNILFSVLTESLSELELIEARSSALGHAERYRDHDLRPVSQLVDSGLHVPGERIEIVEWLVRRQAQLMRLIYARLPAAQAGMTFEGGNNDH
jgi:hypothetical protein